MDRFGVATPDPAGQNAFASVMADIRIEQIGSSPLQCPYLRDTRERLNDRLDGGNLRFSESTGLLRGPCCHVNGAVCEDEGSGEVVGRSFRAELADY